MVTETLSAIAKQFGHKTSLAYDQDIFGVSDNVISSRRLHSFIRNMERFTDNFLITSPDLIVFYDAIHQNEAWVNDVLKTVKRKRPDVRTVYLSYIENPSRPHFDFTLIGEPEYTFNIFLRDDHIGKNCKVFRSTAMADLNELPPPDKDLFSGHISFKSSYLIYTSKGCPCSCSYCLETVLKNNFGPQFFRRRDPAHVIAELKAARVKYDIQEVIYKDSIFALNKSWLREYLPRYREDIRLPFKCFGKAESFDDETAGMLKQSRCYCVEFGVQTFNESLKERVLSREEKTENILKAFAMCERHRLMYDADHLFGIPGETQGDHKKAAEIYGRQKYLNRIKCHNLVFYRHADIYDYSPEGIKDNADYHEDFFSEVAGARELREINACFQKYFKVLPLLPRNFRIFLQRKNHWKKFRYIPNFFIIILMTLLALKNKDRRFIIYIQHYPRKILRAVGNKSCANIS